MGRPLVTAHEALGPLVGVVTPKMPVHVHLDEVEVVEPRTVVARALALYSAALDELARAGATGRVLPMLSFTLAATPAADARVPAWSAVAAESTASGVEPPAVYLIDAATFRAQVPSATTVRAPLPPTDGLPPDTHVEYRTSPTDEGWSRRVVVFPR
jgi:hypothetical protein